MKMFCLLKYTVVLGIQSFDTLNFSFSSSTVVAYFTKSRLLYYHRSHCMLKVDVP